MTNLRHAFRISQSFAFSVCDGIADLSRTEEAENFLKYAAILQRDAQRFTEERKPFYGIIPYDNLF